MDRIDRVEGAGGVIISYGEDGEAVSVEFLHASARHLIQKGEISVTLEAGRVPERSLLVENQSVCAAEGYRLRKMQ